MELLESRVLTLEKQLAQKGAIIHFFLNQKVQNETDKTTFMSKVSNSDIQRDKKPTNSNIQMWNSEEKQVIVKIFLTGDSMFSGVDEI